MVAHSIGPFFLFWSLFALVVIGIFIVLLLSSQSGEQNRRLARRVFQSRRMRVPGFCLRFLARSLRRSGKRALPERLQGGPVAGAGLHVSQDVWPGLQDRAGLFRPLQPA